MPRCVRPHPSIAWAREVKCGHRFRSTLALDALDLLENVSCGPTPPPAVSDGRFFDRSGRDDVGSRAAEGGTLARHARFCPRL